jgi:hypothetical protein
MVCESPGLDIKHCSYNLETIAFPEKNFNAIVDEAGNISIDSNISNDMTLTALLFVGILLGINLLQSAKIALEMNLGISIVINGIDFFHIFIVEVALVVFLYR